MKHDLFMIMQASPLKNVEHQRRAAWTCAIIQIDDEFQDSAHQELFFPYEMNTDQFVNMLCRSLEAEGHHVLQCEVGADTDIDSETLQISAEGKSITVIADFTGILTFYFSTFPLAWMICICVLRECSLGETGSCSISVKSQR